MARNRDEVGGGVGGGLNQAWGNAPQSRAPSLSLRVDLRSCGQQRHEPSGWPPRGTSVGILPPALGFLVRSLITWNLGCPAPPATPADAPQRGICSEQGPYRAGLPAQSEEPRNPWAPRDPVGCPTYVLRDTGLPQESGYSVPTEPSSVPPLPPDQAWALQAPG